MTSSATELSVRCGGIDDDEAGRSLLAAATTPATAPTPTPTPTPTQKCFPGRIRYAILLLTVTCLTATRSNELSFNFNVICMTANSTSATPVPMTSEQVSTVMGTGGFGALVSVLPIVHLLHHSGPRLIFGILLVASGVATLGLAPLAALGPLWMMPGRLVQGLSLSTVMPMMGSVSAEWAAPREVGRFLTLLSANGQLSQIVTMPVAAQLCIHHGWPSVYIAHGLVAAALGFAFLAFYRNTVAEHPCVSVAEIEAVAHPERHQKGGSVPYLAILRSRPVWAVWVAFIGNAAAFQLVVQFMPTFLNKVLRLDVNRTGFFSIIPPLTQLIVKLIAGWASDQINLPERLKLQIFNTIAQLGCAICLLPLGFLSPGDGSIAVACFTASISFLGLVACGSMKSAPLIARSYTHFVMAIVQIIISGAMLVIPTMVAFMAPNNGIDEWRLVFFCIFGLIIFTNAFFCYYCSAEAETWALLVPKAVD